MAPIGTSPKGQGPGRDREQQCGEITLDHGSAVLVVASLPKRTIGEIERRSPGDRLIITELSRGPV